VEEVVSKLSKYQVRRLLIRVIGIGAMMAKALDANGAAKVYIIGRRKDKLTETVRAAVSEDMTPRRLENLRNSDKWLNYPSPRRHYIQR
jgi:hypothetical protein